MEWPPSPGDTPRLWKPPARCSSPCRLTEDPGIIRVSGACMEAHQCSDRTSPACLIRLADWIQFPPAAPPAMPAPSLILQPASSEWLPPTSAPSVPPTWPEHVLPSMQDNLVRAHAVAAARARAHAQARSARSKKEEQGEEETEEERQEVDDGEKGVVALRAHGQHHRAISDGQQHVLAVATHEGLTLPRQNLPMPLIVRRTFIEAPVALPLSLRFSRLRRSVSCPAGAQCREGDCCSTSVAAGDAPQSCEARWMPHMQPCELAALSVGSVKHASRRCKPCAFIHTDSGCANGTACPFCHACSPGEKRRREKAQTQHRKRRLLRQRQAAEEKEVTAQLHIAAH